MPRPTRTVAVGGLAAVALLPAGCHSPTDPHAGDLTFVVRARSAPDAPPGATNPPTVTGEFVQVLGLLDTPTPCQDVSAKFDRNGRTVVLTVTSASKPVPCVGGVGQFAYSAALTGLPAGSYRVRVYHTGSARPAGRDSLVRDTAGVLVRYIG